MKRFFLTLLMLTILVGMQAQRRKKVQVEEPKLPEISLEEALATYDFPAAEQHLNYQITTLKKEKRPTLEQENKLLWLRKAQIKLNAVERVTFIDSIIVPRQEVLKHIPLSPECGTLMTYSDFFKTKDPYDCTVFKSEMGDQIFYSKANDRGVLNLYMRDLYNDGSTSLPTLMNGISDDEENQNYPFMMMDGTTIYFAAQGSESLGGYDIFMSRYDADEHRFLAPENIGMPFNSPYNDYLYMIDETKGLGWFVTDRNTSGDSVCIYVFIPNETRKVYVPEEIETIKLRNLARITNIQDTWFDENIVKGAQYRLREAHNVQQTKNENEFNFIITDNQIYHSRSDFRSQQALQAFDQRSNQQKELNKVMKTLSRLRENYQNASDTQRTQLKGEILMLEKSEEELTEDIKKLEKDIRKLELGL